jgi:hypothetical protein
LCEAPATVGVIVAPWSEDEELTALVDRLRREGNIVLQWLPGQTDPGPDRQVEQVIEHVQGRWQVRPVAEAARPASGDER